MLEIRNVSKNFGGLAALDNVNMAIKNGEIRGLIGPNGSGKSTLINVITGFYTPSKGEVLFKDKVISGQLPNKVAGFGICRTFQNINLFSGMSVLENVMTSACANQDTNFASVMFHTKSYKHQEKLCYNRAREIIDFVGLSEMESTNAINLPYGKQRILEIARALATEPELLMLDEPVAGMNDVESNETANLIQKLRSNGKTILIVEHHMKFVMNLCDYITVLESGAVIAEGQPKDVQSNKLVIESYLGKRGTKQC